MRNIHMMLPPDYRNLWKGEFEVLKKEDVKEGRGWVYEADPFAALRERDEAKALMEKKRMEREKGQGKGFKHTGRPWGYWIGSAKQWPNWHWLRIPQHQQRLDASTKN